MMQNLIFFAASATAFYEEKPVLHFLKDVLHCRYIPSSLTDSQRVIFAKEIKGKGMYSFFVYSKKVVYIQNKTYDFLMWFLVILYVNSASEF